MLNSFVLAFINRNQSKDKQLVYYSKPWPKTDKNGKPVAPPNQILHPFIDKPLRYFTQEECDNVD